MKSVLDKPEIVDITNAYTTFTEIERKYRDGNSSITNEEFGEEQQKLSLIIRHNELYLRSIKPQQYNFENFQKLIEAINYSGQKHFSMSSFFGFFEKYEASVGSRHTSKEKFNLDTRAFNCNSSACIAGFAVALAVNWDEKATAFSEYAYNADHWEQIACNWLNIPLEVGNKIFYANEGCAWSYLKNRGTDFDDLEWESDSQIAIDYGDAGEDEYEYLEIALSSIKYKHAVKLLQMIKDGELVFDENFEPRLSQNFVVKQS